MLPLVAVLLLVSSTSEECITCHEGASREWAASRHASAFDNQTFQVSFARAGHDWCLSCHAPDGARGVGCVSCHPTHERPSPTVCNTCHQFDYPVRRTLLTDAVEYTDLALQDTVAEWRGSTFGDRPCVSCHGAHAARGARDVEWLRSILTAEVERTDAGLRVTISAVGAGHAVPTGDPFRAIRFAIHVPFGDGDHVLVSRALKRTVRQDGDQWVLVEDSRIPPPTDGRERSSVTFDLPLDEPLPTGSFGRLTYEYANVAHHRFITDDPVTALITEVSLDP